MTNTLHIGDTITATYGNELDITGTISGFSGQMVMVRVAEPILYRGSSREEFAFSPWERSTFRLVKRGEPREVECYQGHMW
jgi:hypothetical protein